MFELDQIKNSAGHLAANGQHWVERFTSEVSFAEKLLEIYSDKKSSWMKLFSQAIKVVSETIAAGKADDLVGAVKKAEEILAPIGKVAKGHTTYLVGHAHIDMNWMWSWPETVAVTNDTFTTVLKLMDEFPEFYFSQSQASVYALIKEYNPDLFKRIQKRVAEGRWEITASHWVEGDKNLPSGESLTRHLLYTRRFMKENFNLDPEDITIDWSPDTFGHAHTIPSIDSRGGVKHYYMCRGGRFEKPPVFWWKGPDGSKILVNLETTWYNDTIGPHNAIATAAFCKKTGLKDWMCVYGVGDHGGGPTRRDIIRGLDMNTWPIYPNFKFSTTKPYYAMLEKNGDKIPTVDQELNYEFPGCYTTQTVIKRANRYSENFLVEAEQAAVLANRVAGRSYPTEQLKQAWIDTIFSHFHDILPGSGVRATREYNQGLFQKICATTNMVKTQSLRTLAAKVDTSFAGSKALPAIAPELESWSMGAGVGRGTMSGELSVASHVTDGPRSYVVFNPTAWKRTEVVQASVWDADTGISPGDLNKKSFVVRTSDGKTIPAQKVGSGQYWGHNYVDLTFPVSVEPMGYTAYIVEEGSVENYKSDLVQNGSLDWETLDIRCYEMENEFIAVDFDKVSGGICKLVDKKTGKNLASSENPLGVLEYLVERQGGMSSWLIYPPQKRVSVEIASMTKGQRGPHSATVEIKGKINDSTFAVTYTLNAGEPWINVTVKSTWVERGSTEIGTPTLRMQFPFALDNAAGRYESPFGSIERSLNDGSEVPSQRWASVIGKIAGTNVSGCGVVMNDSKYGHSLEGANLRITLIRSSYDPDILPEIGEHVVRMAIAPSGKVLPAADMIRLGAGFNQSLQVVATDVHKGTLPAVAKAVVECDADNVMIAAIKKAEDENAVIFRLYETAGKAVTAKVKVDKTILGSIQNAVEVDLIERELKASSAKASAEGFMVKIPAKGLASVKVRFK
jgi:alpha-mannosidase